VFFGDDRDREYFGVIRVPLGLSADFVLRVIGLASTGVLMFVWPIPHTISLRYLFVLPALGVFLKRAARQRLEFWDPRLTLPASVLGAFILWMVIVAVFNSSETAWSLGEINGQWTMPLLVCYLGVLVGKDIGHGSSSKRVLTFVTLLPLIAHIVVVDTQGVLAMFAGRYERIAGLTERPDIANYLTNITLALVMAETYIRLTRRPPMFSIGNVLLGVLLCGAAASLVFEHIRNGVVVVSVLMVVLTIVLLSDLRRSGVGVWIRGVVAGGALLAMAGLIAGSVDVKSGSSWSRIIATVPAAWDTQRNREWLDSDLPPPKLPDGEIADQSAYLRLAWFKEGVKLVAQHPFGVGYGRNIFGHQVSAEYNVHFSYHSHSSALDLAIGTGIPGVALWFGFLGVLVAGAWRRLWYERNGYSLALILLVIDYGTRSLIDSNVRDHMLQQFLFLVGMFSYLSLADAPTPAESD
jgi:O-antigen ligase